MRGPAAAPFPVGYADHPLPDRERGCIRHSSLKRMLVL
jgi:hypothetical protein